MSILGAIETAYLAYEIVGEFGLIDEDTDPILIEISEKLDEIQDSIDGGFFDTSELILKLQIVEARLNSKLASVAIIDNETPEDRANALALAETGLTAVTNAVDGILDSASDISPALLNVMFGSLSHSMTTLATVAELWGNGEFTGSGYNHGGLMGSRTQYRSGIEVLERIEQQLRNPDNFRYYDFESNTNDPGLGPTFYFPEFKIQHPFSSNVLAIAFFESVSDFFTPDATLTYEDGYVHVQYGLTTSATDVAIIAIRQFMIETTINDAYYNFMTGLELQAGGPYLNLPWYGDNPLSLAELTQLQSNLVDGNPNLGNGIADRVGTAEDDYLIARAGGDELIGLAGDDYLLGNENVDTLLGGAGEDIYAPGDGNDRVEDTGSSADSDVVVLYGRQEDWGFYQIDGQLNAIRGDLENPDEQDVLIGIEVIKFDNEQVLIDDLTITIVGSVGNDTFQVFDADTQILELADNGNDIVLSYINTYTLGENFEQLVLAGDVSVTGIGNALDNAVVGNDRANALHGEAGNDSLIGLGGDDTLFGGDGNDWLYGGADADDMQGGDGDDTYYVDDAGDIVTEAAGEGYDSVVILVDSNISGYTLADNVEALTQEDSSISGGGSSFLVGNDLSNSINGKNGDDLIYGRFGDDVLVGGTENDTLVGEEGNDVLFGGDGEDWAAFSSNLSEFEIVYDDGTDTLTFTDTDAVNTRDDGTDTVQGVEVFSFRGSQLTKAEVILEAERQANTAPGLATLSSGGTVNENAVAGTVVASLTALDLDGDVLTFTLTDSIGNAIDDDLFEIVGRDLQVKSGAVIDFEAQASSSIHVVVSDPFVSTAPSQFDIAVVDVAETIRLADGGVVMVDDGGGEARIIGGTGDDDITANRVGSVIDAKGGHDIVRGGVGGDIVTGGSGNDHVSGEAGADMLTGGTGADTIKGGIGADTLDGSSGRDDLSGGSGADAIKGGAGDDAIGGGTGGDHLKGGTGNDVIKGGDGADLILGGSGNDKLSGGAKNDTLDGGSGKDILTGNKGADVFVFDDGVTKNAVSKRDVITDFDRGSDAIDLRLIDANKGRSGDQNFDFSGKSAEDNSVWFKVKGDDVIVMGDNTGDGVADFRITLLDLGNLGANDFLL